jgi:hypothetical protein
VRRLFGASTEALIIVILITGLLAVPVLGAKGGGGGGKPAGGGGSLSLVMTADANADGLPNHQDSITFNISGGGSEPMVGLRCWQGSNFVHDGYIALYDASWLVKYFTLDSTYWAPDVDATCTARLFSYTRRGGENVVATFSFAVAP